VVAVRLAIGLVMPAVKVGEAMGAHTMVVQTVDVTLGMVTVTAPLLAG
jgi:hypothetical protein